MPDSPNIGDRPEPEVETPARNPGGVDAINDDAPFAGDERAPLGHDLDPDENPAVEDALPEGIAEPDDKQQEPDKDSGTEDDDESDTTEPPA